MPRELIEEPSETRTRANPAAAALHRRRAVDKFIAEALVIALAMIVLNELPDGPSQVALPCTTRIPASSKSRRTGRRHFRSRSQISTR